VPIVLKLGSLNLLEPSGPVQACTGIALPLPNNHQVTIFFSFFYFLVLTDVLETLLCNGHQNANKTNISS
jgi:hypothetical protein